MGLFDRALRPFQRFAATESAGGILLLGCTAVALGLANSPWSDSYFQLWQQPVVIGIGEFASVQQAALPIAAAVGGMVLPAVIYTGLNAGSLGEEGWTIPISDRAPTCSSFRPTFERFRGFMATFSCPKCAGDHLNWRLSRRGQWNCGSPAREIIWICRGCDHTWAEEIGRTAEIDRQDENSPKRDTIPESR